MQGSPKFSNQHRENFSLFSDDFDFTVGSAPTGAAPPLGAANARALASRPSSSGSRSRNRILHGRPSSAHSTRSSTRAPSPSGKRPAARDNAVTAASLGAGDALQQVPLRPQRLRKHGGSQSPTRGAENEDHYVQREDIINECTQLKKQQRALESEIVRLKYENQRLEVETLKQRRQIEKLLASPGFAAAAAVGVAASAAPGGGVGVGASKGGGAGPTALEIRRDIEKTAVVRQLKLQMNELRELLHSKDRFLESLQKSHRATHVTELEAEKEEYLAEVRRLQSRLEARESEMERIKSRVGGVRGGDAEDHLRSEVVRLQAAYSDILGRLSKAEHMNARLVSQLSDYEARAEAASYNLQYLGGREGRPGSASPRGARVDAAPASPSDEGRRDNAGTTDSQHPLIGVGGKSRELENANRNLNSADADVSQAYISDAGRPAPTNHHAQQHPPLAASKAHSARLVHKLPDDPGAFHSSTSVRVGDRIIVTSGPLSSSHNVSAHAGIVTLVDPQSSWCNFRSDLDRVEYQNIPINAIRLIESAEYVRGGDEGAKRESAAAEAPVPAQAAAAASEANGYRTSDKIEYFDGRSNKWSPGVVLKRWPNETYDLMIDRGGEIVSGVVAAALRSRVAGGSSSRPSSARSRKQPQDLIALGTKVEARYRNSSNWYPGVVREHLVDGTYSIHFDDGEIGDNVPVDHVRLRSAPEGEKTDVIKPNDVFKLGEKVDVNYKGNGIWYSGVIHQVNPDGTFDINYDDGATEVMVRAAQMKRKVVADSPAPGGSSSGSSRVFSPHSPPSGAASEYAHSFGEAGSASVFPAGTVVEARYKGRQWIPARVISEDCQTLCNVVFLDGTKCTVPQDKLFQVSDSVPIELNNHVLVRINDGEFLATLVDKVVLYNYSVEYLSNGERETNVAMNKVRVLSPSNAALASSNSTSGSTPSAHSESAAAPNADAVSSSLPSSHYFPVGAGVSVHNPMTGEYLRATIDRHLSNGYYDVVCSNGDRMKQVSPDSIRTVEESTVTAAVTATAPVRTAAPVQPNAAPTSAATKSKSPRAAAESSKSKKSSGPPAKVLSKGMRVEVRYRGGDEWMAATIVRENADGTVDVDYDEGEREKKVHKDKVRIADDLDDYLAGLSDDDDGDDILATIGRTDPGQAPQQQPGTAAPPTAEEDEDEEGEELGLDYGVTGEGGAVYGEEYGAYDEDFD